MSVLTRNGLPASAVSCSFFPIGVKEPEYGIEGGNVLIRHGRPDRPVAGVVRRDDRIIGPAIDQTMEILPIVLGQGPVDVGGDAELRQIGFDLRI